MSTDPVTASTPPLVDVIAEANKAHEPEFDMAGDCYTGYCSCGQSIPYVDHAAHQARAVLDALTKAGGVEVVTGYGVKLKSGDVERCGTNAQDAKDCLEDFAGGDDPDYNPVEVVTRTTTTITIRTDWTRRRGERGPEVSLDLPACANARGARRGISTTTAPNSNSRGQQAT